MIDSMLSAVESISLDWDPPPETIAVAMSGGVDSSAVAAMLRAQGYSVIGLTLQLWNQRRLAEHNGMPESVQGRCCSIDDVYDARRVAEHLEIPYYLVNQEARFEAEVVKPFVSEYLAGRTPIPCTLCNNHLKFDALLLTARQIGASRIATGSLRAKPLRSECVIAGFFRGLPTGRRIRPTSCLDSLRTSYPHTSVSAGGDAEASGDGQIASDAGLDAGEEA